MFLDEVKYFSFKYTWKKRLFHIFVTRVYLTVRLTFLLKTGAVSTWMFVYELSGCSWNPVTASRDYIWRYFWPKKEWPFFPVFIGILKYMLYFKNEGLNISWTSRYNSILGLKNGFHNTLFYSVSIWTWLYISNMRWIDTRSRR